MGGGKQSPKKRLGWALRFLRFLFNLALILLVFALAIVSGLYLFVMYTYDDQLDSRYPDLVQNSFVYDVDGNQIGEFKAAENQLSVGEDDFGEYLPRALVAVEHRRFYEHHGVDFTGAVFARCLRGSQAWEASRGVGFRLLGLLISTLVVGMAAPALTLALALPPPPVVHEHVLYETEKESSPLCTTNFGLRFGVSITRVSAPSSSSAIKHQPSKRHFRQPSGGDHRSKE